MEKIFKDKLSLKSETPQVPMPEFDSKTKKDRTLWRRTEVLCSNGDVIINPTGKSSFAPGCPFTMSENMVPIGGVQYTMQQLLVSLIIVVLACYIYLHFMNLQLTLKVGVYLQHILLPLVEITLQRHPLITRMNRI